VRGLAAGFLAAGIQPGERVALLAATSYEWTLVDYALDKAPPSPWRKYHPGQPPQYAAPANERSTIELTAQQMPCCNEVRITTMRCLSMADSLWLIGAEPSVLVLPATASLCVGQGQRSARRR